MYKVSAETIEKLSLKHIGRYGGLIRAGNNGAPNIRVDECREYVKIWTSIKKKGDWATLNKGERMELMAAVDDEKWE